MVSVFQRSCVSIHLGQAGVQAGSACWELYTMEHNIQPDGRLLEVGDGAGRECLRTFFSESERGCYVPKAVFADSEPSVVDAMMSGPRGKLFNPELMIRQGEDFANNFARGFNRGKNLTRRVLGAVRRVAEASEGLQGFMVCHSLGGGTGSGCTPEIMASLNDEYGKRSKLQLSVYPAPQIASAVVEPYNAILTTHFSMDYCDCAFLVDNQAINEICKQSLGIGRPSFAHLNRIIGQVSSSITASLRFQGALNVDLADFQTNLVPFPRIHFPLVSYAPIVSPRAARHESFWVPDITARCFHASSRMVRVNPSLARYIACCLLYRGDVAPTDVNRTIAKMKLDSKVHFVDWCPTGFKVGINCAPPVTPPGGDLAATPRAVCLVSNTTAIKRAWARMGHKFDLMYAKRAFVHWYQAEGLEHDTMVTARDDIAALVQDYDEVERQGGGDLTPVSTPAPSTAPGLLSRQPSRSNW